MVTDHEAAWVELAAYVAGKTQHGREGLLAKMAELAERHRVPAGELSRLLRLYGVEVERARAIATETRDEPGGFAAGLASVGDGRPPDHHRAEEVHDGGRNGARVGNGRAV